MDSKLIKGNKNHILLLLIIAFLLSFSSAEVLDRRVKTAKFAPKQEGDQKFKVGGDAVKYNGEKGSQQQKVKDVKNRKKKFITKKIAVMPQFETKQRMGPNLEQSVPTAIFHGFKQSCNENKLIENVKYINEGTDGHTECIEIGNGAVASMFTSIVKQAKEACQKINDHPIFGQRQFNVVGISQGALIGRYIVETCATKFPVRNFVTVGGPNNGMELGTDCSGNDDKFRCQINTHIRSFPMLNTYSRIIQSTLGPTNYIRDFQQHKNYLDHAIFLPYLNNEKQNARFDQNKLRFESLNSLTMIMFSQDQTVFPKESSWFGQIDPAGKIVPMEATEIYTKNLFGLKTIDEEGRVFKIEKDGSHLEYGPEYIKAVIVPSLLK